MNISTDTEINTNINFILHIILYIIVIGGRYMLKNRRKYLEISQEDLAKKLGITQGHLSKIEKQRFSNVNIELIIKLSIELDIDAIEIFNYFHNSYISSNL